MNDADKLYLCAKKWEKFENHEKWDPIIESETSNIIINAVIDGMKHNKDNSEIVYALIVENAKQFLFDEVEDNEEHPAQQEKRLREQLYEALKPL